MTNHQLINATSGNVEYFTPKEILDAVRKTFKGRISLDPASSALANEHVKADRYFDIKTNGLDQPWKATTVWLNHPFGRSRNFEWIFHLLSEYRAGSFREALCITYACTSEAWFRPLLAFPQCFLFGRTNYMLPNGTIKKGVTKGSVVTYLGHDINAFCQGFWTLGKIKF